MSKITASALVNDAIPLTKTANPIYIEFAVLFVAESGKLSNDIVEDFLKFSELPDCHVVGDDDA